MKKRSRQEIREFIDRALDRNVRSILTLLDVETGGTRVLRKFDYLIEAPSFRGADEIVYNSKGRIYSYDVPRDEVREIDTGYCVCCNNDHVLSPDGKRIAVSHFTEEDLLSRIYILELETKAPPFLVTPLAPSFLHGWSPDGETLAYCAMRDGRFDLYTISSRGGVEERLTDGEGHSDGPEYSADGRCLYFNGVRDGAMDCFCMRPDGTGLFRLTHNGRNNWFPHVSPDGQTVVYLSYDAGEVKPGRDHPANKWVELRAVGPDGTGDRPLLRFFGGQGSLNVNSWHPDSRHVAFVVYELKE